VRARFGLLGSSKYWTPPHLVEADHDDPELVHHVGRIKEHGNRALRVVFNKSVGPVRIVTAYFDRKMKGRL
jgi:hypothetical protein